MGGRNSEPRMTSRERGNTWASEEKSGGHQSEARYKGYLKVSGEEEIMAQRGCVEPPKKSTLEG